MQTGYTNVRAAYRKEMHSVENFRCKVACATPGFHRGVSDKHRHITSVLGIAPSVGKGCEKCFIDEAVWPHTAGGGTLRARCSRA